MVDKPRQETTSFNALKQLIDVLEKQGELVRVAVEADPILEIAAITDRVCKQPQGGRALLFERPCGAQFAVTTNLFGSIRRVCLALGVERLEQMTERMSGLLDQIPSPALDDLDRQIAGLSEFAAFAPRFVDYDLDLLTMDRPDLTRFPFLQSWPGDGAAEGFPRYITLPMVFTAGPEGDHPNCGMYRCQLRGPDTLAIRWKEGSGAAAHLEQYRNAGKPMPVAVVLGGPPAALFSAMFPLPGSLDEITFAGFMRGAPMEMAACRAVPQHVPTGVELVIEGYVDPAEMVTEGPFGNHTGYYSAAGAAALLRVTAVSHRPGAIVPATVVGPPPMEDCWMAKAWEAVLLSFLKRLFPQVSGLLFPLEWVFHQSAVISLENPDAGMVRETAALLWQTPWFRQARLLIFVDAGQDLQVPGRIAWNCINLADFSRDIFYDKAGTRMALDATGSSLDMPRIVPDRKIAGLVHKRWQEYGFE